jgi:hypothetical protein
VFRHSVFLGSLFYWFPGFLDLDYVLKLDDLFSTEKYTSDYKINLILVKMFSIQITSLVWQRYEKTRV